MAQYSSCHKSAFATNWIELLHFELVFSILSCFFSVAGGLTVFLVAIKNPQKRLRRTSISALVITMATSALLMGITAEPLFIYFTVATINNADQIHHEAPFLQFAILVSFATSMATLFSLVGITVNRYLFVSVPGWCMVNVTFNRTLLATSLGWIISINYPFLYFNTGLRRYCIVHTTAWVFFTTFALLFTFVWILSKLEMLKERGRGQIISQEDAVSQTHSWLMVFSLGCYVPALVMVIIAELCGSCSCLSKAWLQRACFVIVRLHCAVTPALYTAFLNEYRSAVKTMVVKCPVQGKVLRFNSNKRTEREINCFEMNKLNGKLSSKV